MIVDESAGLARTPPFPPGGARPWRRVHRRGDCLAAHQPLAADAGQKPLHRRDRTRAVPA